MKKIINFGCSFAVGNSVPCFMPGLKSGAYIHSNLDLRLTAEKKYNIKIGRPTNCGKIIADKLQLNYEMIAENGASNEMIFRKLLQAELKDSFVLIGMTSYNRREALTTLIENDGTRRWHTWKMVEPDAPARYKDLPFNMWNKKFTPAIEEDGQIRSVIQILYMQSYLQLKNIPYLMYNSLYNGFDVPLTEECRKLLCMVDQKKYYKLQGSSHETQHGWCLKNKLVVSELDEHPRIDGQTAWAEKLMPLVEKIS